MTETLQAPMEPHAGLQRRAGSRRSPGSPSPEGFGAARRLWWRRLAILPGLALLLALAMVLAGAVGEVPIPPLHTAEILLNQIQILHWHVFHFPRSWPIADEVILLQLRLPRVAGAALVGLGLAVSGTLFQGLLRNPLADPLLLGTSSGAALGASIAFVVPALFTADWLGFGLIPALAFVGALLAVALVYSLASRGGHTPVVTLLLAGVAVSAVLTALQTLIITRNDRLGLQISSLYLWLAGGVDVQTWQQVEVILAAHTGWRGGRHRSGAGSGRLGAGGGDGLASGPLGRALEAGDSWSRRAAGGGGGFHKWSGRIRRAGSAACLPDCAGSASPNADSGGWTGGGDLRGGS